MQTLKTIEQERAAHALNELSKAMENANKESKEKITSCIKNFAPMVKINGFGQTYAFYLSKKDKEYKIVLDIIASWLTNHFVKYNSQLKKGLSGKTTRDIMKFITECSREEYRYLQNEALAYINWLKKLVDVVGGNNE